MKHFSSFLNQFILVTAAGFLFVQPSYAAAEATAPQPEATTPDTTEEATPIADQKAEAAPAATDVNAANKVACEGILKELQKADEKIATLKQLDSSQLNLAESRKERVVANLGRLQERMSELEEEQKEYDTIMHAPYAFKTPVEERFIYTQKGDEACTEIMKCFAQKSIAEKAVGLNKFEVFDSEFKGIEGYEKAKAQYIKIVSALYEKWNKSYLALKKKRTNLNDVRLEALEEKEEEAYIKYGQKCKEEGINIKEDWFSPLSSNLKMLETLTRKAKRVIDVNKTALEDFDTDKEDKQIGAVSPILIQYWEKMDAIQALLVAAKLEEAEKAINEEEIFTLVFDLPRDILSEDYCTPMRDDYKELQSEIRSRKSDVRSLKSSIARKDKKIVSDAEIIMEQATSLLGDLDEYIKNTQEKIDHQKRKEEKMKSLKKAD